MRSLKKAMLIHIAATFVFAACGCIERESVSGVRQSPAAPSPVNVAPVSQPVPVPATAPAVTPPADLPLAGTVLTAAGFACRIEMLSVPKNLKSGELAQKVRVKITNNSSETWPNFRKDRSTRNSVNLGYHWQESDGKVLKEGQRSFLPEPLAPGHAVEMDVVIDSLPSGGNYQLKVEPVQEGVAWFSASGGCSATSQIKITP